MILDNNMSDIDSQQDALIEAQMREWLARVVVGLNLCPFARKPFEAGQVRVAVSHAQSTEELLDDLQVELAWLDAQTPTETETTLIVAARMLGDFLDYNDFLGLADTLLFHLGWEGQFQIASFHPQYQFADTREDDAENYSNRAPWPTLQVLRENSLEEVLKNYPAPEQIPERNIETMNRLGQPAMEKLLEECRKAKPKG